MKYWVGFLTIAVVTLSFFVFNAYCNDLEYSSNNAGGIVSALGVLVTIVVAWQIYSTIISKEQVSDMEKKYSALRDQLFGIGEKSKNLVYGWRSYYLGRVFFKDGAYRFAYESYFEALEYYIKGEMKLNDDTIKDCLDEMSDCIECVDLFDNNECFWFIKESGKFDSRYLKIISLITSTDSIAQSFKKEFSELKDYRNKVERKHKNEKKHKNHRTKGATIINKNNQILSNK